SFREAKKLWQLMRAQGDARDDAPTAAAAAFQRPKEVRIRASVGHDHPAVGNDHFRLQQSRRSRAEALRERTEASALPQSGNPPCWAATAVTVAAGSRRYRIIKVYPHGTGLSRDGRHWREFSLAALGNKGILHRDFVHCPCPDQQRVRRIGGAEITMTSAFDDKPQIVFAGKVDASDHVSSVAGPYCIFAGRGSPSIQPA